MVKRQKPKARGAKTPTIVDVARIAQVSVSTAARVLRNADYPVHPTLAKRVRTVVDRIGYVPNRLARSLRGAPPDAIGLIVGTMIDAYHSTIAEAVTRRAEEAHSFLAIVCNMQRDPLLELKYCRQLWEHRVSGVILAGGGFDQWTHLDKLSNVVEQMVEAGVQVVTLSPRGLNVPIFSVDNEEVGRIAARRLLAEKHKRIGIIFGPPRNEVNRLRQHGIVDTLREAGATYLVEHVENTTQSGGNAVVSLLNQARDLTAIISGSDAIGIGVVERLHAMGRAIPRDLSVISLGNTSFASRSNPPLSSVDVELERTGRTALDFLVASARRGPLPAPIDFRPSVVERATIGKPRRSRL